MPLILEKLVLVRFLIFCERLVMSVFDNNINTNTAKNIDNYRKTHPDCVNLSDAEILTIMNEQLNYIKINEEEQISAFWNNNNNFNPLKINKNSKNEPVKTNEFNKKAEQRLKIVSAALEEAEGKNGFIGKAWSGFKNLTGIGDSSDKVREKLKHEKELLKQFSSDTAKKTLTDLLTVRLNLNQNLLWKDIKKVRIWHVI